MLIAEGTNTFAGNSINLAVPRLMDHFGTDLAATQWVSTSFQIARTLVVPILGWLGGMLGNHNRTCMFAVFTPLTVLNVQTLEPSQVRMGQGLLGIVRNIGGSLGSPSLVYFSSATALLTNCWPMIRMPAALPSMASCCRRCSKPYMRPDSSAPQLSAWPSEPSGERWISKLSRPGSGIVFCCSPCSSSSAASRWSSDSCRGGGGNTTCMYDRDNHSGFSNQGRAPNAPASRASRSRKRIVAIASGVAERSPGNRPYGVLASRDRASPVLTEGWYNTRPQALEVCMGDTDGEVLHA